MGAIILTGNSLPEKGVGIAVIALGYNLLIQGERDKAAVKQNEDINQMKSEISTIRQLLEKTTPE